MRSRLLKRRGYTLLEMILALGIGVILLGALYVFLNDQVRLTQLGRDTLDEGTLARSVLSRLSSDIRAQLGPIDVRVLPEYATPAPTNVDMGAEATEGDSGATTDPATGTTTMPMTGSGAEPAKTTTTTETNTVTFNLSVYGTADKLYLSCGRAARPGLPTPTEASGLRRIIYMVVSGEKSGLVRYEATNVTAADVNNLPADLSKYLIPEVRKVLFEYWDGQAWQATWEGNSLVTEDGRPQGPPSAIRVTLTIAKRGTQTAENPDGVTSDFTHVIALPAGNNFPSGE